MKKTRVLQNKDRYKIQRSIRIFGLHLLWIDVFFTVMDTCTGMGGLGVYYLLSRSSFCFGSYSECYRAYSHHISNTKYLGVDIITVIDHRTGENLFIVPKYAVTKQNGNGYSYLPYFTYIRDAREFIQMEKDKRKKRKWSVVK